MSSQKKNEFHDAVGVDGRLFLVDKPAGVSSFGALGPLKRELGIRKVGHTGTLDPFATGLLVVLSGWATRLAPDFSNLDKRYVAIIRFGESTETLDSEGTICKSGRVPTKAEISDALLEFHGEITQRPPAFSAIKIGGIRAYRLARTGSPVEPEPRVVTISELKFRRWSAPEAEIEVACSKGTYIRSLARDIAVRLGTVAHVRQLIRSEVGPFALSEIPRSSSWYALNPVDAIRRIGALEIISPSRSVLGRISHGQPLSATDLRVDPMRACQYTVVDPAGALCAVVGVSGGTVSYRFVVNRGSDDD